MTGTAPPSHATAQEPSSYVGYSKDVPWYVPGPPNIPEDTRELLETYSKVPPAEVIDHVEAIREKAWLIHPYPCIGGWRFLTRSLPHHPSYNAIVSYLKRSAPTPSTTTTTTTTSAPTPPEPEPRFLDLGCCMGQDIRALRLAGVPSHRIKGAELEAAFVSLGYELFRDDAVGLGVEFFTGDVLSDDAFGVLRGTVDVLHASAFLHLWDWPGQVEVAVRMVALMRGVVGVRMVGRQVGSVKPGTKEHLTNRDSGRMFKHDVATFEELWSVAGEKTGTKWKVSGELKERRSETLNQNEPATDEPATGEVEGRKGWGAPTTSEGTGMGGSKWHDENTRILIWEVERIA